MGEFKASKHSSLEYFRASAFEPFKERVTFTSVSPEQITVVHEPGEEDEQHLSCPPCSPGKAAQLQPPQKLPYYPNCQQGNPTIAK